MIKTICFLTTYRCNARCDFCECGPGSTESIPPDMMIRLIDEAHALGTVGVVVFSGGEPTLLKDDLLRCIRHATARGLLTRIVTNGWWGQTPEAGLAYVDRLLDAGLSEINISIDDLHQEWIPLEHVRNAYLACYQRRLKCLIAHKQLKEARITHAFLEQYFGVPLVRFVPGRAYTEDEQLRLISTGTVIPVGRNETTADQSEHILSDWRASCSAVLRDIIVGAGGNFLPCCGIVKKDLPELTRHDLRQTSLIDAIDDANRDVLLNWIALEGPAALAEFVHQKDPSVKFRKDYVGICHICSEVLSRPECRRVLARHIDEIKTRVSLHRAFLERGRKDRDIMSVYVRG